MKLLTFFSIVLIDVCVSFGQGWEPQYPDTSNIVACFPVSTDNCWVCGDHGLLKFSGDGGQQWNQRLSDFSYTINDIDFVSSTLGIAVSYHGEFFRTTDGGSNWDSSTIPNAHLYGVDFVDAAHGWVIANTNTNGKIYYTTDRGASWTVQVSDTIGQLRSVSFANASNGWAVGFAEASTTHRIILHTSNGINWRIQLDDNNGWLWGVYAVDSLTCYSAGSSGTILKTTDGGVNWNPLTSNTTAGLTGVFFVNRDTGYVVGESGTILKTTDSGATWHAQPSEIFGALLNVRFATPSVGWAVGMSGATVHTTNGGVSWVSPEPQVFPDKFAMFRCFPNPFNATTTISFELPKPERVTLTVYDLLGRWVTVLKDGFVEAGSHRITFNGSGLASGIYFTRLDAGEFSQTKKLMLLK